MQFKWRIRRKAAAYPASLFSLTPAFGFPLCFPDRYNHSWRDGSEGGRCVSCSVWWICCWGQRGVRGICAKVGIRSLSRTKPMTALQLQYCWLWPLFVIQWLKFSISGFLILLKKLWAGWVWLSKWPVHPIIGATEGKLTERCLNSWPVCEGAGQLWVLPWQGKVEPPGRWKAPFSQAVRGGFGMFKKHLQLPDGCAGMQFPSAWSKSRMWCPQDFSH